MPFHGQDYNTYLTLKVNTDAFFMKYIEQTVTTYYHNNKTYHQSNFSSYFFFFFCSSSCALFTAFLQRSLVSPIAPKIIIQTNINNNISHSKTEMCSDSIICFTFSLFHSFKVFCKSESLN